MAGGAWFAHFRAPVLISPFQNHLRNGLRRAIVTWEERSPSGIDPWEPSPLNPSPVPAASLDE